MNNRTKGNSEPTPGHAEGGAPTSCAWRVLARLLISAAAPAPALAADPDPLAELVAEYRRQTAIFCARAGMTDEEADAFADETFRPAWERLRNDPPAATTRNGAIEALRLAHEEMGHSVESFERPLVAVALAYFEREPA